jgi:uncharacterized protein involved in outer membrane biogenesis
MLHKLKRMLRRRTIATATLPARPGRKRRLVTKLAIGFAVALALFTVVGFFVVPPVAKHYAVKILSEQLDRPVSIREIEVNPFAMTAAVRGFAVMERDGSETFVAFEELFVNLQAISIWERAPVLYEIRLTRPYVHAIRQPDGKTYHFSDLLEKFAGGPAQQEKPSEPARFSLNNIQVLEGRIKFHDHPKHSTHDITDINIAIPFVSNLPYLAEQYVQPAFAAKVNGTPFALKGQTKPFKDSLETTLDVDIDRLPVARYVEYLPATLGFRIPSGLLTTKLAVSFTRFDNKVPALRVSGDVRLEDFELTEPDGTSLLLLPGLTVPLTELDLFGRKFAIGQVALRAPEVFVRRERDGALNWVRLLRGTEPAEGAPPSASPAVESPAVELSVAEVRVEDGKVHVLDQVPAQAFRTDLSGVQASLKQFALPQQAPATVDVSFATGFKEEVSHSSTLRLNPLVSEGTLSVKGLRPANYASYYRDAVLIDVNDGQLALSTAYRFEQPAQGEAQIAISGLAATLNALRLRKRGAADDFLRIGSVSLKGLDADVGARTVQLAELQTRDARLVAKRAKDGVVDLTQLIPANAAEPPATQPSPPPWSFTVRRIAVDRYGVVFEDQMPAEPVVHTIEPIGLKLDNLSNRADSKAKVALDLKVNRTGSLQAGGQIGINPIGGQLDLLVQNLDLVPLQPYFQDRVNIVVGSGALGTKGTLQFDVPAGGPPKVAFSGDLTVANFASVDKQSAEDLLKWKSLFVSGIDTVSEPFSLAIREVALSDFYSRIVIFPDGHLNLQDIVATRSDATPDDVQQGSGTGEKPDAPASAPPAAEAAAKAEPGAEQAAPMPPITVGKVTLQGGDINFTDLFIKPNYSANLSELGGSVTGLSSQLDTTADVELRARFAKTAPVEIKGKVNPLVRNLFLDLKAGVRDIELGPFTPYSGKYVGYAIEKGKMTFNVEYKIENRKLAGKNQIVLNQLAFGDKIENPQATKLPVLLAVALLRDRNGVIDVNLPISGSLDDPKFSIGGIILRIIFNLIEKAVTAPFALIGSLVGGGGEELAYVEFDAGRATVTGEGQDKLAKLQQALIDRPGLKLDITPRADPEGDRERLRRYRFEQQVKAQKLKDMVKKRTSVGSVDEVNIEPSEYEVYLKKAYKAAKFPKPRNAIGLPKDLPAEEMEKLMLTNTPVTDDDLVQLANARAQAAKDGITKGEQVALERVFLLSPKVQAAKADDKLKASRVDFSLK